MRSLLHFDGYLLYLLPLAFLGLFYVFPLLTIFDISLRPAGAVDLSAFVQLLSSDYYTGTLAFTVYQAALSTAATLLLAVPSAYVFVRYQFPGKSLLLSLATLPFVLPTVVVALAFTALLGHNGLLNDLLRTLFSIEYSPLQLERTPGHHYHCACLLQLRNCAAHHRQLLGVAWFRNGRSGPLSGRGRNAPSG